MVNPSCAICHKSWKKEKVKFFGVPKDAEKRNRWNESCGVNLQLNAKVCEKHFLNCDFINPPGDPMAKRARLLPNAVPSVFSISAAERDCRLPSELDSCLRKASSCDWRLWCRLCAKEDIQCNKNMFVKDEMEERAEAAAGSAIVESSNEELIMTAAIEKYFSLNIKRHEGLPEMLCTECFTLVTSLISFGERVAKVQKMFHLLDNSTVKNATDLRAVRLNYGLLDEDREHVLMQQPTPEVVYFKAEPKIIELGNKIYDVDQTPTNPLEQPLLNVLNDKETTLEGKESKKNDERDPFNSDCEVASIDDEDFDPVNMSDRMKSSEDEEDIIIPSGNCDDADVEPSKSRIWRNRKKAEDEADIHFDVVTDKFPCTECNRIFQFNHYLQQHLKYSHSKIGSIPEEPQFTCTECSREFTTKAELKKHTKVHVAQKLKKTLCCPYCDKKFAADSLRTHIRCVHMNVRPYICEECGKAVHTSGALKKHMLTHTDYAPFECEVCQKGFKHKERLKKHMETHNPNKHICPECGQKLNSRATLQQHLVIHSDEKKHQCDYCGRAFKLSKALKSHLLIHTGLKPYSCEFCGRTFSSPSTCRAHKKNIHPEEFAAAEAAGGGRTYACDIPKLDALKAITKSAGNLKPVWHKKSIRKPYDPESLTCNICGLQLKSRATLYQHLVIHSDEKRHKCDYCGRAFKHARGLKCHLIIHAGLKPYICNFCGRSFANGPSCRSHKKRIHPVELAELEASGGGKIYTLNIPHLKELKAITKTSDNLTPVASRQSGRSSPRRKAEHYSDEDIDDLQEDINDDTNDGINDDTNDDTNDGINDDTNDGLNEDFNDDTNDDMKEDLDFDINEDVKDDDVANYEELTNYKNSDCEKNSNHDEQSD